MKLDTYPDFRKQNEFFELFEKKMTNSILLEQIQILMKLKKVAFETFNHCKMSIVVFSEEHQKNVNGMQIVMKSVPEFNVKKYSKLRCHRVSVSQNKDDKESTFDKDRGRNQNWKKVKDIQSSAELMNLWA